LAAKKETENTVKQGKSNNNNFWINYKVYQLLEDNSLVLASGGKEVETETELVQAFIKRNKKVYFKNVTMFDSEPKQYNEKIGFGKYSNLTVSELVDEDLKYAKWILEKCDLAGKEKLKQEITEILKK
jgi:hypothetical protein